MPRKLITMINLSILFGLILGLNGIARAQESVPAGALAPVGSAFTYQGQLQNTDGPITGNCDFQFSLWDALSGGTQVGSTLEQSNVTVSEGLFTVQLDFGTNAFTGSARWLEITVRCPAGDGAYSTLAPRQPLSPAPYALYSANADTLDGVHAAAFASSAHTHWGQIWYGSGTGLSLSGDIGLNAGGTNYGVEGFASSTDGRGIYGSANATTGFTYGVYGASLSNSGTGVYGIAGASSGYTNGVYGWTNSTSGKGVYGVANSTTGETYGVMGHVYSTGGRGVYGYNSATTGMTYGVFGQSDSTNGTGVYGTANAANGITTGVFGVSDSTEGRGVYGVANATTGLTYGVLGRVYSSSGIGVLGNNATTTGTTYGIVGQVSSTNGTGVYGTATATSGGNFGVRGMSQSTAGVGVGGEANHGYSIGVEGSSSSTTGTGVWGYATSTSGFSAGVWGQTASPEGWGVYGQASCYNCNWGVFSNGNLYVTGNSYVAGSKSAVVPTQDYGWVDLYSMESPRVLFEDVNTAQLINGQAVVTIEPVFAQTVDLTQPYQVFLTPNGDCSLYVSSKTTTAFTVSAQGGQTCSISFDYRIIAVRQGYADTRLEQAEDPAQVTKAAVPAPIPPEQNPGDQP